MRAANDSQYTLGRTFLQEAYLIADYERRNFSISQCSWVENANQDIRAIRSPADSIALGKKHQLTPGSIAGIVIGGPVAASAFMLGLYFYYIRLLRSRRTWNAVENTADSSKTSAKLETEEKALEIDGIQYDGPEIDGRLAPRPELAGIDCPGQEMDARVCREMEGSHVWPQEIGEGAVWELSAQK